MTPQLLEHLKLCTEEEAARLNRIHGVVETVDQLRGWHLVSAELYKPGVYRIAYSCRHENGATMRHGFARQDLIRTAIELGYLSKPNGYTLP